MGIRFAWIGLGNMGRGMAKNLIQKGNLDNPLILHNRNVSRAESLANEVGQFAATVAQSIEEAVAAADVIFTCLANDAAIKDVMQRAVQTNLAGKTFVDCTTVHPDVTSTLASMVYDKGALFASMTVLGSPSVAATGQLICIISGPTGAIDMVKPYITGVIGRALIECRNEPAGKSDLLKLIVNTFILNVNEIIAEGLAFAEKASVPPRKLQELLSALFGGPYVTYAQRMVGGDYHKKEAQVPVEMALKDAHHALRIAAAVDCALPSLETAEKHLQAVKERRGPTADSSSVYGVCRVENGLPFEN